MSLEQQPAYYRATQIPINDIEPENLERDRWGRWLVPVNNELYEFDLSMLVTKVRRIENEGDLAEALMWIAENVTMPTPLRCPRHVEGPQCCLVVGHAGVHEGENDD